MSSPELGTFQPRKTTLSTYNRQHPMEYGPDGEAQDPLEKNFDRYTDLLTKPANIDEASIIKLPLSIGILRSYVEATLKEGLGREVYFADLKQKYGEIKHITDVFDYAEAVRIMKAFLQREKERFPKNSTPPNTPPSTSMMSR